MTGMETDVSIAISAVVLVLVQVLKMVGIAAERGRLLALAFSLLGVGIYAFSFEPSFERMLIWKYFTAFAVVMLSAMGAFNVIKDAGVLEKKPPVGGGAL